MGFSYQLPNNSYAPTAMTGGNMAGSIGGGNAYGSIPQLPSPVSTAPGAVSGAISGGNTVYNQLPGYGASLSNIGKNIGSETAGQLPTDVIRNLQQSGAERGIATGTGGSPNNDAAYLRALGLTSLQMTQMGQDSLLKQLPMLPGAQLYQNPGLYPSSGQKQEVDTANAIYASAPDPRAAAMAAMGAANAGLSAGRGASSNPFANLGGGRGATDFWNTGAGPQSMVANSQGTGTYIGGQYYGAGQGPLSQEAVDQILRTYGPTATGSGGGGFDWGDETQTIPPAYMNNTPASATAPAGTSAGYYYAGGADNSLGGDNWDNQYGDIYGGE